MAGSSGGRTPGSNRFLDAASTPASEDCPAFVIVRALIHFSPKSELPIELSSGLARPLR